MEIKTQRTKRQVLKSNRQRLAERVQEFNKAVRENHYAAACFWWAKVHRRMAAIRGICADLKFEQDDTFQLTQKDYVTNLLWAARILAEMDTLDRSFDMVRPHFGHVDPSLGFGKDSFEMANNGH